VRSGQPGAAATAARPGFRWSGAAGLADLETGERLTPDHRFRVSSVSKIFIAAVVLQLVDEGAVALDDDAEPIVAGVTVRQLLNHTSGLPDPHDDLVELFEPYRRDPAYRWPLGPRELLASAQEKPRLFPPGDDWAYSGSNYLALGLLIEETTGSLLREELTQRILGPLELGATDLPAESWPVDGLARGYLPGDNPVLPGPGLVDVTELDLPFNWAGGGVVSNGADVARFLGALLGGELLPAELQTELLRTVPSDWEESDGYGLGIEQVTSVMGKTPSPCGAAWGHLGFSAGSATIALASERGERQVVVMTNAHVMSDEAWEALGRLTWACYCGEDGSGQARAPCFSAEDGGDRAAGGHHDRHERE
jgi:D-alanyl-D-alanine carboxypeptidase